MSETDSKQIERANALIPEEVILHIGMTKAGSTAIQNAFEKNYQYLFNQGILFPKSVFSRKNPFAQERTSGHLQLTRDIKANNLDGFIEELERTSGRVSKLFISAENLFQDVEDLDLHNLAQLLAGKTTKVIIILRSQPEWLASRYFQSVVGGDIKECRSFEEFVHSMITDGVLDFGERIRFVTGILGTEQVSAFDYDHIRRAGGTIDALCRELGLEATKLPLSVSESESNISLPFPEALEAHHRLNLVARHLPLDEYKGWCAAVQAAATDTARERGLRARHITASRDLRKSILEACIAPNRALSRQFLEGNRFGPTAALVRRQEPAPLHEIAVKEIAAQGLELLEPYIANLRSAASEEKSTTKRLKADLNAAKKQPAQLSRQVEKLADRISSISDKFSSTQEQLEKARRERDDLRIEAARRADALATSKKEYQFLSEQLESASESVNAISQERDDLVQRLSEAGDRLTAAETHVSSLQVKLAAFQTGEAELRRSRDAVVAELKEIRRQRERAESGASKAIAAAKKERDAFIKYADELETRFKRVLRSRTWRVLGPYRVLIRKIRGYLRGRRVPPNSLPKRPKLLSHSTKGKHKHPSNGHHRDHKTDSKQLQRADHRRIDTLCKKLNILGFSEKPLAQLVDIVRNGKTKYLRALAAKELALWHIRKRSDVEMRAAWKYLAISEELKGAEHQKNIVVLKILTALHLNDKNLAKEIFLSAEKKKFLSPDAYLAFSSIPMHEHNRIQYINSALELYNIPHVHLSGETHLPLYDRLACHTIFPNPQSDNQRRVSIILAAYNAKDTISTTLRSLQAQTWKNTEIIVIDDCSTDNTCDIVQQFSEDDDRIMLIRLDKNSGAYVARNRGLEVATGDYVTVHDADDWSHPAKISTQAKFLNANPKVVGCTSEQARATDDLQFFRLTSRGKLITTNISSFMFRRTPIQEKLGYWDSVRFGADTELVNRATKVFGANAVRRLRTGPLSFQRVAESSIVEHSAFGTHGVPRGARLEYHEAQTLHHNTAKDLKYPAEGVPRPFAVPRSMLHKVTEKTPPQNFDVVIASDFRMQGGSTQSSLEEIRHHKRYGIKTGIFQLYRYDMDSRSNRMMLPALREEIDGNDIHLLAHGDTATCDLLILRYPPVLNHPLRFIPKIIPKNVKVIVNQPPMSDYSNNGVVRYDLERCADNIREQFGMDAIWHPIGPLVREALHKHHSDDLSHIQLSDRDWHNIIDAERWHGTERIRSTNRKLRIGRHSRDHEVKWPATRQEILTIYPDSDDLEIHILGGADSPREKLGYLPSNWTVHEFGSMHPNDFLASIDVYIYFTHHEWVESFGRVIIEAMAAGVPVILPEIYRSLFGNAALYATPDNAVELAKQIYNERASYDRQVSSAKKYIELNFSYEMHLKRLHETGIHIISHAT